MLPTAHVPSASRSTPPAFQSRSRGCRPRRADCRRFAKFGVPATVEGYRPVTAATASRCGCRVLPLPAGRCSSGRVAVAPAGEEALKRSFGLRHPLRVTTGRQDAHVAVSLRRGKGSSAPRRCRACSASTPAQGRARRQGTASGSPSRRGSSRRTAAASGPRALVPAAARRSPSRCRWLGGSADHGPSSGGAALAAEVSNKERPMRRFLGQSPLNVKEPACCQLGRAVPLPASPRANRFWLSTAVLRRSRTRRKSDSGGPGQPDHPCRC